MDTDTIDHLFLELSQFTNATTGRELALIEALKTAVHALASYANDNGSPELAIEVLPKLECVLAKATATK